MREKEGTDRERGNINKWVKERDRKMRERSEREGENVGTKNFPQRKKHTFLTYRLKKDPLSNEYAQKEKKKQISARCSREPHVNKG